MSAPSCVVWFVDSSRFGWSATAVIYEERLRICECVGVSLEFSSARRRRRLRVTNDVEERQETAVTSRCLWQWTSHRFDAWPAAEVRSPAIEPMTGPAGCGWAGGRASVAPPVIRARPEIVREIACCGWIRSSFFDGEKGARRWWRLRWWWWFAMAVVVMALMGVDGDGRSDRGGSCSGSCSGSGGHAWTKRRRQIESPTEAQIQLRRQMGTALANSSE